MFVLVVGGGKIGSYLTRALLAENHEVVVIEKQERKAKMLEALLDAKVAVVGDGCDPLVHESAGAARADVVVADTGDDEDNLVVCLIAKKKTRARCIARVNNPSNKLIFESLDPADPVIVISATEIVLDVLNEYVSASKGTNLETLHLFGKGNMQMVKVGLPAASAAEGKRVGDLDFPRNSVLVAVVRDSEQLVIPNGDTELHAGDKVIAIVRDGAAEELRALLA